MSNFKKITHILYTHWSFGFGCNFSIGATLFSCTSPFLRNGNLGGNVYDAVYIKQFT